MGNLGNFRDTTKQSVDDNIYIYIYIDIYIYIYVCMYEFSPRYVLGSTLGSIIKIVLFAYWNFKKQTSIY